MKSLLLNGMDWTLTCYWQNQWLRREPTDFPIYPALPPVAATVPGAVHEDLLAAGVVADWRDGLNAAACEWINNRDWSFTKQVTVPDDFGCAIMLECDGLDYSGSVLIDGEPIARFEGTHYRHELDLSEHVRPGQTFELEFIFDVAPRVDGVYGFTSRTRVFKPRFGYYWDWCPRVVNVGFWQDIRLVSRGSIRFDGCRVLPRLSDDLESGYVRVAGKVAGDAGTLRYQLCDEQGRIVCQDQQAVGEGTLDVRMDVERVAPWWPATHGAQPLYTLTVELLDATGAVSDRVVRTIGFKRVRWLDNPGAPDGARPYLCEVNGRPLFIRGVNWVPLSPLYGTVTAQQYEAFVSLYRRMNCNLLRVWGGAILETPAFYEACDRLGLMVWQEFPLSSSGIDNWPPEEPKAMIELERIATEYVERRCHHACHVLWCGGNELQGAVDGNKVGIGKPVDESHPLMQRWGRLIERLDPGKRFLATSPSGPRFFAAREDFGKGLHHQTHGPWGNLPLDERYAYFNNDDSIFRSELGAPGSSSIASLRRHAGDQALWPPRAGNPYWMVPGASWMPWDDVTREFGPIPDAPASLPVVVKASRYLQAESYRYAAEHTRRRHPHCSGFIVWMGHDTMPITSNNSIAQRDGSVKPAYDWLQKAYAPRFVSLRHDSISYRPGARVTGEIWIGRDDADAPAAGGVAARLRRLDGRIEASEEFLVDTTQPSSCVGAIDWEVPECVEQLFVIELLWEDGAHLVTNRYLLSQVDEHPLSPMLSLPSASPVGRLMEARRVDVVNDSSIAAIGARVICDDADHALLASGNHAIIFPGERHSVDLEVIPLGEARRPPTLELACFNAETVIVRQ